MYAAEFSKPAVNVTVGVHVGDVFNYKLNGVSVLGPDATTPAYLADYNNTEIYQITITGVNGTEVSFITLWKFYNGTTVTLPQTLDIANGNKTDSNGFWAIYPANLKQSDLLRPKGFDGQRVNATDNVAYGSSSRHRDFWAIENQFFNVNDPTHNTWSDDYVGVYFDQQTGMLTTLSHIQRFNNPQYNLIITWQLVNCTVWSVQ